MSGEATRDLSLRLLARDFKYFFLIVLMFFTIAVCWLPLKAASLLVGDRCWRALGRFFLLFD